MTESNNRLQDLIESLKQQRDELRVQIHLGKAEAKEEWERLEKKWERLMAESQARSKSAREELEASARDVGEALELVADELKEGYQRIRKLLAE